MEVGFQLTVNGTIRKVRVPFSSPGLSDFFERTIFSATLQELRTRANNRELNAEH
jgi:hypothetical protein